MPLATAPETTRHLSKAMLTRRRFLGVAAGAVAGLAFYAGEIGRHELEIIDRTIRLARLPAVFAGMKIAQISDIHFEEYTEPAFLKAVVRRVNGLTPDLVVLTGDFVSSKPLPRRWNARLGYECAEILSHLQCPLRYAIMGNHDAMVGVRHVTDALVTHGIPVLTDSYLPLERGSSRLWLAGTRDALVQHPDLDAALPAKRDLDREPLILLAHEPDFADYAVGRHIDLMLSGHTHGGQVLLPLLPPLLLPEMGTRYVHGLFRLADGMQLYVNRGIGAVTLPFRFRCPPEITLMTLQPASA